MKIRKENVVEVQDWDKLVKDTYKRPYQFQQQDGCKSRGFFRFSVPDEAEDFEEDTVPEIVNHDEMGVSFAAWLKRDPEKLLVKPDKDSGIDDFSIMHWDSGDEFSLELWWGRNFYPDIQMVANDLHEKGLLEADDYTIDIDW